MENNNPYKPFTDHLKLLYDSFIESGFTSEQAYGFTLAYSNEHAAANVNDAYDRARRRKDRIRWNEAAIDRIKEHLKNRESEATDDGSHD